MGKVAAAEMKKKKGRPSLLDLQKRTLLQQQGETLTSSNPNFNISNRRSTRRNPNLDEVSPTPQWIDGEGDDDDERKEKKVKLVVRLPHSNQHYHQPGSSANSFSLNSVSYGSDSNADAENHEASPKKRKINVVGGRSGGVSTDEGGKVSKAMDILTGSQLESGPTTPLPDKKLLVFILDRLQKKDTYGVFSEPVDLNELPDYGEIIEHPMDFGTVRKKLDEELYSNLEEFEADVLLICSNAMQYNAPDTIYFRQARSIQELAKRDFENLRQVSEDGEPRPKIVRRGRPPSKNIKKPPGKPPHERLGPELASDATLATGGDNSVGSNAYNLRRAPMTYKFQSTNALVKDFHRSRNNETSTDWLHEWNEEFPASILKAEAKYGRKQYSLDENRRATYEQFHPLTFGHEPSVLTTFNGQMKQLLGVGLHLDHGYARSLARFAANLGPDVWKIASKKIESVLPTGLKFGPGWVGESEALPQPMSFLFERQKSSNNSANDDHSSIPITPSTSCINPIVTYGSSSHCKEDKDEATYWTKFP
ncbi:hypothetical protein F0562_026910 [Nyssa sinensis]|uniref:Bromo domain-containing protein n=1 Tax=Nyssa sinensis TaxID=561372 RepID=A0A5J5B2E2_9ASTE|nr:hypothetical protein F0562_026910 [Nyssa sinensis]